MPRFVFPLAALLRYRRHRRELCRQLLAGVLADAGRLEAEHGELESERRALLDDLRRLGESGRVDIDGSASRRYYATQLGHRLDASLGRLKLVEGQLALCRQALARADGEVRMLEKLEETRRAEHRQQEERRAAHELEDVWNASRSRLPGGTAGIRSGNEPASHLPGGPASQCSRSIPGPARQAGPTESRL